MNEACLRRQILRTAVVVGICLFAPMRAAAQVPSIRDVLGPGVPSAIGGVGSGVGLLRVDVNTDRFPRAICADGTDSVFYVRRWENANDRDKWVF